MVGGGTNGRQGGTFGTTRRRSRRREKVKKEVVQGIQRNTKFILDGRPTVDNLQHIGFDLYSLSYFA